MTDSASEYAKTSAVSVSLSGICSGIFLFPDRTGWVIAIAVIVNTVLSLLFGRDISTLGWIIRSIFLLAGLIGALSKENWKKVKAHSFIIGLMTGKHDAR